MLNLLFISHTVAEYSRNSEALGDNGRKIVYSLAIMLRLVEVVMIMGGIYIVLTTLTNAIPCVNTPYCN